MNSNEDEERKRASELFDIEAAEITHLIQSIRSEIHKDKRVFHKDDPEMKHLYERIKVLKKYAKYLGDRQLIDLSQELENSIEEYFNSNE